MKKESLSKNFLYQMIYQIIILFVPLLISPYLTRTLEPTALGNYTYAHSISYYFVLIAMLGISRHGQRIIAERSNNEIQLRKTFWSLFFLHIVASFLSLILYFIFLYYSNLLNDKIYLYLSFYVLSAMFDVTWLFYGLENFKSVVLKNGFVQFLNIIFIFLFVKEPSDVVKYTFIVSFCLFIGQIIMIPQVLKFLPPIKFNIKDVREHVGPVFLFSISVIAVSFYTVFDKTLLGILTNAENVAYYEYANKIITIPKTLILVIGTVFFPRAVRLVTENDKSGLIKNMRFSFILTSFIGMGAMFGLIEISSHLVHVYYGDKFLVSGEVLKYMSGLPIIIGMGDILRTQYLIPKKYDKEFNFSIILNAIINIIISYLLIPKIGIYGAVVGTYSAELFGFFYQLNLCKDIISIKTLIRYISPFFFIGLLMYLFMLMIHPYYSNGIFNLFIIVLYGGVLYIILSLIYIFIFEKDIKNNILFAIKRKLKKR